MNVGLDTENFEGVYLSWQSSEEGEILDFLVPQLL
jgi:hypothetical protein